MSFSFVSKADENVPPLTVFDYSLQDTGFKLYLIEFRFQILPFSCMAFKIAKMRCFRVNGKLICDIFMSLRSFFGVA